MRTNDSRAGINGNDADGLGQVIPTGANDDFTSLRA
jgi:hypothetical protein